MCTENSYKLDPSKTPIILLHGWGMNKSIWSKLIERLPNDIRSRLVCLDLPGYGDNRIELSEYNLDALTTWLANKIEQPSIVIGWSLGGLVAQSLAYQQPNKVAKLGLIASTAKFMQSDDWLGIKPEVLDLFLAQLSKDHIKTIERFLAIQAMGSDSARQDIQALKETVLQAKYPDSQALKCGLTILQQTDLRAQLSTLTCPLFAVFGKLDSLVPIAIETEMKLLNATISTKCIQQASHAPFISHSDQFLEWLLENVV